MPGKKTLIVAILAFILGVVVLFLNLRPSTLDSSDLQATLKTEDDPDAVTKYFYEAYTACLLDQHLPPEALGNVSAYCQTHTGRTSSTFSENLESGSVGESGADPITCSQNLPESTTIGTTELDSDTASVYVREEWGTSEIKLEVQLVFENGKWLVNNVVCPQPPTS